MRVLVLAGALALAGCGQSADTVSNIPEDEPTVVASALDAGAAVEALKAAGLPVAGINAVTEATDTNNMMGRPGGYTSKAFFFDQRHEGEGDEPAQQNTIEVFANEADATKRREYIQSVTEGMPFLTQYMIQSGPMLLRLDKVMTPTEAKEYEAALGKL